MTTRRSSRASASESRTERQTKQKHRKIWNIALGVFLLHPSGDRDPDPGHAAAGVLLPLARLLQPRVAATAPRGPALAPAPSKVENAYRNWRRKSREKRLELIRRARKMRHDIQEKVEELTQKGA
jgi:hypothetical protein